MLDIIVDLFYGVLFFCLGLGLIKYRRNIKSWTGNFLWAEKFIGNGGTYFIMILVGLFLMFLGVLYPFGGIELIFGEAQNIENVVQD